MDIAEAKMRCNKIINDNNEVIREARKNGDINTMQLTASLDNDSIAIDTVLNELEKKDKVINEMAKTMVQIRETSEEDCFIPRSYRDINDCIKTTCEDCIIEYFTNKAENVGE